MESLSRLCATYPYRGIKGAVGTRLDQVTLLGSAKKAEQLDQKVMHHLGATANWENVGQVYPRSLDLEVVSLLVRLASAPSSFAKPLELWRDTNYWEKDLRRDRLVHPLCHIK